MVPASRLRILIGAALLLVALTGCKKAAPAADATAEDAAAPADPMATFTVSADNDDLVFQYFTKDGQLKPTTKLDEVPEDCRTNVVVLSRALQKGDLPADQVIVANLEQADDQGNYPYRLVSRYEGDFAPAPAAGAKAPASPSTDKVLVFTTPWCPHCRTAKQWLAANSVPFEEHDVEKDPNARSLLASLGKAQGIPEHMLSSVPILYVNGKLILGFNEGEVRRLLGK